MQWSAGGILVQLVLDADHIRPSGGVDVPGLIESVCLTVEHECVVTILRGIEALIVPLNVVPARRPVRTRNSIQNPGIAQQIDGNVQAFQAPLQLAGSRPPSTPSTGCPLIMQVQVTPTHVTLSQPV